MELRFVTSESAFDYFRTTRAYLEAHGKPVAFYSDKHGIFRVNRKEAVGGDGVTQFGRALLALNIDIICANSPQAKDVSNARLVHCRTGWSRSCGWRGYRRLPRRTHGCLGSSPRTTRASAVIRRTPKTCIDRRRKPRIGTSSGLGARRAHAPATGPRTLAHSHRPSA